MNISLNINSCKLNQKGAGLIEVLIAIVIIGIGLLGIAGLQVVALKSATQAGFRSNATDFASSLADRIRGNQGAYSEYGNYANVAASPVPTPKIKKNKASNTSNTNSSNNTKTNKNKCMNPKLKGFKCDPDEMAQEDLTELNDRIRTTLPGGTLNIACDDYAKTPVCGDNPIFHITISWKGQFQSDNAVLAQRDLEEANEIVMTFNPGTLE